MSIFTRFFNIFKGHTVWVGGAGSRSQPKVTRLEDEAMVVPILDCNATHIAAGQVLHVIRDSEGRIKTICRKSEYTKLFERPNNMMTGRDFLYAMAWQLQVTNTAFAWIKWDSRMHPLEIWPLVYLNFEVRELKTGGYAIQINDTDGQVYNVLMEDIVCLRRHYDGTGYAGRGNVPLGQSLEMVHALDEGLIQALRVSNKIHGLVRQKNAMLATGDVKKAQEEFAQRMAIAAREGGVVAVDSMEEYTPISINAWSANAVQAKQITDRIYAYWRTPEAVVMNEATEQVNQNYLESIIEPVWREMEEAFTNALFTRKEQAFGSRIVIFGTAGMGTSWTTRLNIINNTKELGLLTPNEYRELLGYGPVEDGDERQISLNFVQASDQSAYQMSKTDGSQPAKQPADKQPASDEEGSEEEDDE